MSPYVPRSDVWPGMRRTLFLAVVTQAAMVPMLWYGGGAVAIPLLCLVISAGLAGHAAGYSPACAWVIGVLLSPWFLLRWPAWERIGSGLGESLFRCVVAGCIVAGAVFGTLVGFAQRWEE